MDITLNNVLVNAHHSISAAMNGLTPVQKKVALFVIPFLALVVLACLLQWGYKRLLEWKEVKDMTKAAAIVAKNSKPILTTAIEPVKKETVDKSSAPVTAAVPAKEESVLEMLEKNRLAAFEQQKKDSKDEMEISAKFVEKNPKEIESLISHKGVCKNGFQIGIASSIGLRDEMQDADVAVSVKFTLKDGKHVFDLLGVFDGHGVEGDKASSYLKKQVTKYWKKELKSHCPTGLDEEGMFYAADDCFKKLHADYTGPSGSTAAALMMIEDFGWIANVGDSRIIIVKADGTTEQVTKDAKPYDEEFKKKIEELGGSVTDNRVDGPEGVGGLAVASAIGDKDFTGVIHEAVITRVPLDFKFAIIACDGLWDITSSSGVGKAVMKLDEMGKSPEEIAGWLVYHALANDTTDNVSIIVIKNPGAK